MLFPPRRERRVLRGEGGRDFILETRVSSPGKRINGIRADAQMEKLQKGTFVHCPNLALIVFHDGAVAVLISVDGVGVPMYCDQLPIQISDVFQIVQQGVLVK